MCKRDAMINTDIRPRENESDKEYIDRIVEKALKESVFGIILRKALDHLRR